MKNKTVLKLLFIILIFGLIASGVYLKSRLLNNSQITPKVVIPFIRNYNLWVYVDGKEKQLTNDAPAELYKTPDQKNLFYDNPQLSPDKSKIAFTKEEIGGINGDKSYILLISVMGGQITQLLNQEGTIGWFNNDRLIYYSGPQIYTGCIDNGNKCPGGLSEIDVNTKQITFLGQWYGEWGCGGGGLSPAPGLANEDSVVNFFGIGKNYISHVGNYILFSVNCDGRGIGEIPLDTHKLQIIDTEGALAKLSPDGHQIAAIKNNSIVGYSTITEKETTTYQTNGTPLTMYWIRDGNNLLYTSHKLIANYLNGKQVPQFTKGQDVTSIYKTYLNQLNLDIKKSIQLEELDAYGARIIDYNPNENTILLSVVENDSISANSPKPVINIEKLNLSNHMIEKIITNAEQASYSAQ